MNYRKFRGRPWLIASTFALVIGSFPAARLAAADASCPVRSSDVVQSITLDNVHLTISGQALPESEFYVAPGGAATQIATVTTHHPYCGLEIVAIPYGWSPGTEELPAAKPGGGAAYFAALATARSEAGAATITGPTVQLFGQSVTGSAMVLPIVNGSGNVSQVLVVEWVAEAGDRLWLMRSSRELPNEYEPSDEVVEMAALVDLSVQARDFPPTTMARQHAAMSPATSLPTPSWWAGTCDDTNFHADTGIHSYVLASYLGMPACGPEPQYVPAAQHVAYFFQGAWPVTEFQCVELSKRYLYLAFQVAPYQANGSQVVWNYQGDVLQKIENETGQAPQPGDVLSYGPTTTAGHTSVVTASSVNGSGNGTVTILEENGDTDGVQVLDVAAWDVEGNVSGWLHYPDYGHADVATFYGGGSSNAVLHGWTSDGTSLSGPASWWSSSTYYPNMVGDRFVSGDFDGNGLADVATIYDYGSNNAKIHVWTSDGSPPLQGWSNWWTAPTGTFAVSAMAGRLVAGDFNADGRDDLAALYAYDTSGARMYVWLSTGSSFSDPGANGWWAWGSGYYVNQVADRMTVGDFNGDGRDDVATQYDYGSNVAKIHVWLSNGSSFSMSASGWWDSTSWGSYAVGNAGARFAAGDFNADGNDDIVALYKYDTSGARLYVWLSNSPGTAFSDPGANGWWNWASGYYVNQVGARLTVGDLDADGDADVATMYDYGSSSARIHVWLSNGSSAFSMSNGANGWWASSPGAYDVSTVSGRLSSGFVTGQ